MYAEGTDVPVERSRAEIERLLTRYGATRFMSGWDQTQATIAFEAHGRRVRFQIALPAFADVVKTEKGRNRSEKDQRLAKDREERRRWRALALVIKAKLEAVESKVCAFEDEFLAHFVLPGGATVGERLAPWIGEAYTSGKVPPLLPAAEYRKDRT